MAPKRPSKLASRKSHSYTTTTIEDSELNQDIITEEQQSTSTITANNTARNGSGRATRKSTRLSIEPNASSVATPPPTPKGLSLTGQARKTTTKSTSTTTTKGNSKKGKDVKVTTSKSKTRGREETEEEVEEEAEGEDQNEGDHDLVWPKDKSVEEGKPKNKKIKSNIEASGSGASFVPRAAEGLGTPVKAQPVYGNRQGDFFFGTNPPTPAPAKAQPKKRGAPLPKDKPQPKKSKTTRASIESVDDSPGPIPSTSQSSPYRSPARGSNHMAPIYTAETPKQMRNLALRGQGGDKGTPGSAGRRGSVDRNRGKRASQIGNGQEALPHPDIKTDVLYRLLDPLDPYNHRMRSLVRWTAHRRRDSLFPPSSTSKNSSLSNEDALAKEVMDEFITGISDKTIQFSAEPSRDSRAGSQPLLIPHASNTKNRELLCHLKEDFEDIQLEDTKRLSVIAHYDKFLNDHETALNAAASKPVPLNVLDISVSEEMTYPAPRTMEEALAIGKALLAGEGDYKIGIRRLGKGKAVANSSLDLTEEDLLKKQLNDIPLQSAHFKLLTHRIATFTTLSSTYVQTRVQQTHQSLSEIAQSGLSSTSTSNNNNPIGTVDPDYRGGISDVVKGFNRSSSASRGTMKVVSASRGTMKVVNQSMDMRDLLRAIASADLRR